MCFVACLTFFCSITDTNFSVAVFLPKLSLPIFSIYVSFALLLARVCFCLCFSGIMPGPGLICCVFYFSFVFFLTQLLLFICCCYVCAHLEGVPFLSFGRVFGDRWFLFAFVRMYA